MKRRIFSVVTVLVCMSAFLCFADGTEVRFTDVPSTEWFAESVAFVRNKGLMNGMTETTFEPQRSITRGMIVTVIYRSEGSPAVSGELGFTDVKNTDYYYAPIQWAFENGIVNGYGQDIFAPNDEITREQLATILYRYAKTKRSDVIANAETADLSVFEDSDKIRTYALEAMSWAYEKGLLRGMTATTLEPQGKATRAQAATIFMRLDKLFEISEAVVPNESEETENGGASEEDTQGGGMSGESGNIGKEPAQKTEIDKDENIGEWDEVKGESDKTDETGKNNSEDRKESTNYSEPTIVVDGASAKAGESVEVSIRICNSPKILGAVLNFRFDEALTLTDAQKGDAFSELEMTKPGKFVTNCNFVWDGLDEPAKTDGVILTLTFAVSDKAVKGDKYEIECSYLPGDLVDENFEELDVTLVGGRITVQ